MNVPECKTPFCFGGQAGSLNRANASGVLFWVNLIIADFGSVEYCQFCGVIQ